MGWITPAVVGAIGAGLLTVAPVIGLLVLVLGVVLVWRRQLPTHVAVVAVPVVFALLWCVLGGVAGLAHVALFTTALRWWLGWLVVTGAAAWLGTRPMAWVSAGRAAGSPGPPRVHRVRGVARWAFLPAAMFTLLGAYQSTSAEWTGRWLTRATDPMQLILLMQQMAREGALVYSRNLGSTGDLSGQAYPKGLHWLATAALGPSAPTSLTSPEALALYVRTFGGIVWLSVALLLCVAAGLFLAAARRWNLGTGTVLAATGWLTALVACVEQFGGVVVVQGAFASAVAVGCVWALLWVALAAPRVRIVASVVGGVLFLTANTWQPMLAVVGPAGVVLLCPYRRGLLQRLHPGRRGPALAMVVVGALAVVVTAIPVAALLLAGGASVADAPGGIQKPFWPAIVAAGLAVLWVLLGPHHRDHRALSATVVVVVVATTIVWLSAALAAGWAPFAYYPSKVLWFLALFGWPLAALLLGTLTAGLMSWLARRTTPARWLASRGSSTLLCTGLAALALVLWWAWRSPSQLVAAAAGKLGPSVPMSLSSLPTLAQGAYLPYLLGSPRETSRTPEYEAAKILAFRFGTPYLAWGSSVPTCQILQSRSPVVLVTVHPPEVVDRSLRTAHCALPDWRILRITTHDSPVGGGAAFAAPELSWTSAPLSAVTDPVKQEVPR